MKILKSLFFISVLFLASCKKDEKTDETPEENKNYLNGKYVVNEGSFNQNNASLCFIDAEESITNDIYLQQNGTELGDILQSFTVIGENGYAVVNNSQKIEVVSLQDFKNIGTIEGVDYPRYLLKGENQKAYISNGGMEGAVKVLDLSTNTITSSIAVGNGPEKMVIANDYLFVCNSGGFTTDNTVSVININSNEVVSNIVVGDRPSDIVKDVFGNVWVLCSGETLYDENWNIVGNTNAALYRINIAALAVTANEQIGVNGDHPLNLEVSPSGDVLYYENNGVFAFNLLTGELPGNEIIADDRGSLNVDPSTGEIWCASVSDFSTPSTLWLYNANGSALKSFTTGIGTNAVAFPD